MHSYMLVQYNSGSYSYNLIPTSINQNVKACT